VRWLVALAALVASGVAAASPATVLARTQVVDRVPLTATTVPAAFPPGLAIALASPARFATASRVPNAGRWVGPRYASTVTPGDAGNATIDWSVSLDNRPQSAEAAATGATVLGFAEDQRGAIAVPHVVGRTPVGTIQGFYVLKVGSNTAETARAEAALAFPLGQSVFAIARFTLLQPPSDEYRVEGGILPTAWNRGQAFIALAGVRVEGNFAPALVSIRAERGTRLIRGKVVDAFRHRVLGAPISLERRVGSAWRRAATARTNKNGVYAVRAPIRGRYRVTATVGTSSASSKSIPVR
jgi:hypothetical protein